GLTLDTTLTIAGAYARLASSNYSSNNPYGLSPQTAQFIQAGFKIGQSGVFGQPSTPLTHGNVPMLTRFMRSWLRTIVGLMLVSRAIYFVLISLGLAPSLLRACITETHRNISGVSGFDFEISKTDSSTIGEDASISVFASRSRQARKVLLFKYDPS